MLTDDARNNPPPLAGPKEEVPPKEVDVKKKEKTKKKKKELKKPREKMHDGDELKSDKFQWEVIKILGSGGFGDVYQVRKKENEDKKEYAMKTEMCEGERRMLRLKVEVTVLHMCQEITDPDRKRHFVEFIDRGKTEKFKFLVMGLVGPSLEDIRKAYLFKSYSRGTAMNCSIQTLKALADLHWLGWLHRDIKPQNFAVGLEEKETIIYMLDFGIARKIFKGDTREIKLPRSKVKFLGTMRFAARACHHNVEQGRKDDVETWLYMMYDLLDEENGLPWKRAANKAAIVGYKEKFFKHGFPKVYKNIPKEMKKIVDYLNGLSYADEPQDDGRDSEDDLQGTRHSSDEETRLDWQTEETTGDGRGVGGDVF